MASADDVPTLQWVNDPGPRVFRNLFPAWAWEWADGKHLNYQKAALSKVLSQIRALGGQDEKRA